MMQKSEKKTNLRGLIPCLVLGACLALPFSSIHAHAEHFQLKQESQQMTRKPINLLGDWRISIIELDGAFIRVPDQVEGAFIQINNNQIVGVVGCNNFMSPYVHSTNPQQITISEGASTRKMCYPKEVMEFEDSFLRAFIGTFMVEKNFEGVVLVRDNLKIHLVR